MNFTAKRMYLAGIATNCLQMGERGACAAE